MRDAPIPPEKRRPSRLSVRLQTKRIRRDEPKMAKQTIACSTDNLPLHFVEARSVEEAEARDGFEKLLAYVRGEAQGEELHAVERGLFVRLLSLGLALLRIFLSEKGTGRVSTAKVVTRDGTELRYHSTKRATYLSIFGTLVIERAYYWDLGEEGVCPLDAVLNIPERRYSRLLQEWAAWIGVGRAFEQVTKQIETWLRVKLWNQAVQLTMQDAAEDVDAFYEEKPAPAAKTEAEFLVAELDGKGVPIRREEARGKKLRLAKGEKPNKKKEAVAFSVFTIDRFKRTAADIAREVRDDATVVEPEDRPKRPKPVNKYTRATLGGREAAFQEVARLLDERDPLRTKKRLLLMDGSEDLQKWARRYLASCLLILDIWHVLVYLWEASLAFHAEGSAESVRWVMGKLKLVLEGKVGYVIGDLRRKLGEGNFPRGHRGSLVKAIRYLNNNRQFMRYDEYLAGGYPIGSGVIEGACRHLVRDRMECTGMRWSIDGAQAVLDLRAVEINGDWASFWDYRAKRESEALYAHLDIDELALAQKCAA
jgi:hypothetical protein